MKRSQAVQAFVPGCFFRYAGSKRYYHVKRVNKDKGELHLDRYEVNQDGFAYMAQKGMGYQYRCASFLHGIENGLIEFSKEPFGRQKR